MAEVQRMEEDMPAQVHRMEDVHMETLNHRADDNENQPIQQTHASQVERAANAMETEAPAVVVVTNARLSIVEE